MLAINTPILVLFVAAYLPPNYVQMYLSTFVSIAYPYVPLLTLPMGAAVIVEERESGTLQYVMANPISKADFLLGRMAGMLLATTLVILVGFGLATTFVYGADFRRYGPLLVAGGAAGLLNMIMLGLAFIISVLSKRKATAMGVALFLWLGFTVISDLGTISVFVNLKSGPFVSLIPTLLNPIDTAQNWATLVLGNSISQTSSTGLLITKVFGPNVFFALVGSMAVWLVAVWTAVILLFRHQDVV